MQMAFSLTTARRLACTERTIHSLSRWIADLSRVTRLLHLDDGSSPEDRLRMRRLLRELVPAARLTEFADIPFPNARHHATMMQIWHEQVEDDDYVFHCEDDWESGMAHNDRGLADLHPGPAGGGGAVERRAQFTQDHGCGGAGRLQTATSESFSIECARQRQLAAGQHGEPSV